MLTSGLACAGPPTVQSGAYRAVNHLGIKIQEGDVHWGPWSWGAQLPPLSVSSSVVPLHYLSGLPPRETRLDHPGSPACSHLSPGPQASREGPRLPSPEHTSLSHKII